VYNSIVGDAPLLSTLRRALRWILVLGFIGVGAELALIGHTEDVRQWIPLVLEVVGAGVFIWHGLRPGPKSTRAMQGTMLTLIVAGFAGMYYHIQGSAEFKLESHPHLAGWQLFWEAIRSKTPPPLAPSVLIYLGFVGLVYTYRHPALYTPANDHAQQQGT